MVDTDAVARVSWRRLFLRFAGWQLWVGLSALLLITLFSALVFRDDARFARDAVPVAAEITAKYVNREVEVDKDGVRREFVTYVLRYAWVFDGQSHDRGFGFSEAIYDAARIGDAVEVLVLPDRPEVARLSRNARRGEAVLLQVIAAGIGLAILRLIWRAGTKANSAVWARENGKMVRGEVRDHKRHDLDRVRLQIKVPDGPWLESFPDRAEILYARHPVGSKVWVYLDKRRGWWEGDVGARLDRQSPMPDI